MLASLSRGLTDSERRRVIDAAVESGVNLIDTADSYAQGECERFLGGALGGRRDRFIVCTKAGYVFASAGGLARLVRPLAKHAVSYLRAGRALVSKARSAAMQANIRSQDFSDITACVESSLQRLRTDHLDVFLLHNPPVEALRDERVVSAAQRLLEDGKIRMFGVSSDESAPLDVALTIPQVSVIQTPVHPFLDEAAKRRLAEAARLGRAVIANQISLSGALLTSSTDPADPYHESRIIVQTLAARHGCSVQRLLMGYAASHPGVSCVLTGTTRPEHVRQNATEIGLPSLVSDAEIAGTRAAAVS